MQQTFTDLHALGAWLYEMQQQRASQVRFDLQLQLSCAQLHQALDAMLPMVQRHSRQLRRTRTGYAVIATLRYRDGVRMADAWRKRDLSTLNEQEQRALKLAEKLVDQARQQAEGEELLRAIQRTLAAEIHYECPRVGSIRYGEVVSAVCALTEGRANCQGISDAMYLVGTLAGLNMGYQCGRNGHGAHLWNIVYLDGQWRIVDTTHAVVHGIGKTVAMQQETARDQLGLRWESWADTAQRASD